ncbi:uncharacterized protein [Oryza sativa Japonica Group]|uniref:uncharacterized protein isoform X2 n=1 Tax=Oryza sativa subsp. japonica TaxID=39947 RepID=UPI00339CD30C
MAQDSKLDLLLKSMAENEKKREEAEARMRADFAELKKSLEIRLPAVEKKVDDLGIDLVALSNKVEQLEHNPNQPPSGDEFAGKVTTVALPKKEPIYKATPPTKEDSTWEDMEDLCNRFPRALAWGQANFQEWGIVRPSLGRTQAPGGRADDKSEESEELKMDGKADDALQGDREEAPILGRGRRHKKPSVRVVGPEWAK